MGKFSFSSCFCFSSSSPSASSTQPSEQAIGRPCTPSSSSHISQEPSTASNADFDNFLKKFNDISQLHELIHFIEDKLLKIVPEEKSTEGSSSRLSSYFHDGHALLQMVEEKLGILGKTVKVSISENIKSTGDNIAN
ncbi:uncharacterized protein LOC131040765 [Cryptomeria japonica]|uniref:uncharacterized protein LOC131040765 n=1 Tax=Cryptomeria japonica TaxID=3369 RepID=UPI0025ABBA30|nr:uncharacterized protein LOC131040765 [Cryptomeria japonica]